MALLTILTIIYLAILVLALAVSLIAIWVYLRRIASRLGEVHSALAAVQTSTEPLAGPLQLLREVVSAASGDLSQAGQSLTRADEKIADLGGKPRKKLWPF